MSFTNNILLSNSETRTADTKREIGEILAKINTIETRLNGLHLRNDHYLMNMFNETLVLYVKNLEEAQNKIGQLSGTEITDLNSVVENLNGALEQMTKNIEIYQKAEDDYRRMELLFQHLQNKIGGNRKIKKSKSKSLRNKRSKTRKH